MSAAAPHFRSARLTRARAHFRSDAEGVARLKMTSPVAAHSWPATLFSSSLSANWARNGGDSVSIPAS